MTIRYEYMDWLRVLAIFTVVGIHVASKITSTAPPDEGLWQFANLIAAALRWCVPIFFMISGALLLTRKHELPIGTFLNKRLTKVVIPLLAWSAIYITYKILQRGESYSFSEAIQLVLTDEVYYHLWFLYVIIGLYLMAPFLKMLVEKMTRKQFLYFLGLWFLFSGLLPFIPKFLDYRPAFTAGMFDPYIGYFMLGAYLVIYPIHRKYLLWMGGLAILGYIATVSGTLYLVFADNKHDEFFYGYSRPNTLMIVLFIFTLFQHLENHLKSSPFIRKLSTATLGIYVLHPLVQTYLHRLFGIHEMTIHPSIGVPLTWLLLYFLSFGIILCLQKIPIIKKIVP